MRRRKVLVHVPDLTSSSLIDLARQVARPGMLMLEIGSWTGEESSCQLGSVAKENGGHLVCIDWWKGSRAVSGGPHVWRGDGWPDFFEQFLTNIREKGLEDVVFPLRGDSRIGTSLLREGAFDLVYIDGEHSYATVRSDIVNSVSLLRDGGILVGHDLETGLTPEVEEFCRANLEADYVNGCHPGVTLAVGLLLPDAVAGDRVWRKVMTKEAKEEFFRRERWAR